LCLVGFHCSNQFINSFHLSDGSTTPPIYIPMPDNVVALSRGEWAKIKDKAGKPLFAAE
jgi:hypothetical protein